MVCRSQERRKTRWRAQTRAFAGAGWSRVAPDRGTEQWERSFSCSGLVTADISDERAEEQDTKEAKLTQGNHNKEIPKPMPRVSPNVPCPSSHFLDPSFLVGRPARLLFVYLAFTSISHLPSAPRPLSFSILRPYQYRLSFFPLSRLSAPPSVLSLSYFLHCLPSLRLSGLSSFLRLPSRPPPACLPSFPRQYSAAGKQIK